MERGAERFTGMVVVPDASGGLVRWLVGRAVNSDARPRFQALPGPKPVLGLGRLGPAPLWAVVTEGVFDWIALAGWEFPACADLGTQGVERVADALRGCARVRPRLRLRRRGPGGDGAASDPARTQGRRGHPSPGRRRRGRARRPATRTRRLPPPALAGGSLRSLAGFSARHSPTPIPTQSLPPTPIGGGPMPISRRACPVLDTGALPAHGFPQRNPHRPFATGTTPRKEH